MSNEDRIKTLESRKRILIQRDPVRNGNIIHKIDREIRKLSNIK